MEERFRKNWKNIDTDWQRYYRRLGYKPGYSGRRIDEEAGRLAWLASAEGKAELAKLSSE